jgi:hypothetical protein
MVVAHISRSKYYYYYGLLALCFAFPLLSRIYTLPIPVPLNPDEAQWTVSARRILDDPIVWRSNDLTTSGPLNALVISWPYLLGLVPSIFTSRATGLLLQSGALLGVASLIRPAELIGPGTTAVMSVAAFLALTTSGDYVHYSSELLSLALIVSFCVVFVGFGENRRSAWRWALCGLIATSLPLAKMQSAPFCLLFHAACVGRLLFDLRHGRASWGQALAYLAGSAAPALALIAPLFLVGEQQAVLTGYFGLGSNYVGIRGFDIFRNIAPLILVMAALMAAVFIPRRDFTEARWDVLLLSFGLWFATFLSMWLPGRNFAHYRQFAFVGLPLAVVLAQRSLPPVERGLRALVPLLAPVVATIAYKLPAPPQPEVADAKLESAFASDDARRSRPLFAWTGVTSKDSLLMWGWQPALTAYSALKSADRASHAEYLIRPNSGRDYFRDRLLRDLRRSGNPPLVLDTVRPGYFFANYPDYKPENSDLRSFPALYEIVAKDYDQIGGVANADCAAVYLRRDLVVAWRGAEIPLRGSAAALVDGSITENCGDWWTPEKGADSAPDLVLDQAEPVRELWILASRGGPTRDRGSTRVRVRFITPTGDEIEQVVHLFDYPLWTVISNPDDRAISHIAIDTLDYVGAGPALNEVKAFRIKSGGG